MFKAPFRVLKTAENYGNNHEKEIKLSFGNFGPLFKRKENPGVRVKLGCF